MEILKPPEIFTSNYWLTLHTKDHYRNRTLNQLRVPQECYLWSGVAMELINADGYSNLFQFLRLPEFGDSKKLYQEFGIWTHVCLKSTKSVRTFIADGTAVQFDSDFPLGYYGFLEDASDILQAIYQSKL